ncbi:MAG: thioredoxin family protein [Myxococcales bacterium]|nr:thioredoxin family protein [Myxococcales bacterium]
MRAWAVGVLLMMGPAVASTPDAGVTQTGRTVANVRLLYFHSAACASCRRFEVAGVPAAITARLPGLRVEKVDVFADEALVTRYGVEVTPTLVLVDADGFPLGKPRIELDAADATVARVAKLVEKMTK